MTLPLDVILSGILVLITSVGGWLIKRTVRRIDCLEKQITHKMDKDDVKEHIEYKLAPLNNILMMLKEDLDEIKKDVKRIIEKSSRSNS